MRYAVRLCLAFLLFFPAIAIAQQEPLRIGLILPLSGPAALWGQHLLHGAELALSKAGDSKVTLHVEDDHLDSAAAVAAYKKLRSTDKINAVLVFGSQSANAVVPLAEREGVVSLVVTTDPKPTLNTKYAVRLCLNAKPQAISLARFIQQRGIKRVALVGTTHEAMLEYLSSFEQIAPSYNIEIVFKQDYQKGESDFRSQLDRMMLRKPEAVVISLLPPSLSSFGMQFKQRQAALPLFAFAQAENLDEITAARGALEDLTFASVVLSKEFTDQFKAKFAESPQSYAGYSFDLVTMVATAAATGKRSSDEVIQYLRSPRQISGACGSYVTTKDFDFDLSTQLMRVRGGKFEVASEAR